MELNPHDLIRVSNRHDLITAHPLPAWAEISLTAAPYVVVCRSTQREAFVTVGIRGPQRGQRLAATLKLSAVQEVIRPGLLTAPEHWKNDIRDPLSNPLWSLKGITPILNQTGLYWGPTGSAAFELATGIKTITTCSDLDLMLKASKPFPVEYAVGLLNELESVSISRLDIQLNTPLGGASLKEYVTSAIVLVKTETGPVLVKQSELWRNLQ
jgi:phosphoribosyl-dephospho-CoA transferase